MYKVLVVGDRGFVEEGAAEKPIAHRRQNSKSAFEPTTNQTEILVQEILFSFFVCKTSMISLTLV